MAYCGMRLDFDVDKFQFGPLSLMSLAGCGAAMDMDGNNCFHVHITLKERVDE